MGEGEEAGEESSRIVLFSEPEMLHKEHQRVRRLAVRNTSASYEFAVATSAEPTTISDRVLLTIAFSSACSLVGTLNLSSVR